MLAVGYAVGFDDIMLKVFSILWVVFSLPVVFLHLEYYFRNRGQRLEIQEGGITFHESNGERRGYNNDDIEKIVLYKSASLDKGGFPLSTFELYHYARIVPRQGSEIVVTSLMAPKVEDAVKQIKWVKMERKKSFFASLPSRSAR